MMFLLASKAQASSADWAAAIGTIGALAVALYLATREHRDRVRDQARQVAAWSTVRHGDQVPVGEQVLVVMRNGSPEPIYNVVLYAGSTRLDVPFPAIYPPVTEQLHRLERSLFPAETHGLPTGTPGIEVRFTDASGNYWRRSRKGRLKRVSWLRVQGQRTIWRLGGGRPPPR